MKQWITDYELRTTNYGQRVMGLTIIQKSNLSTIKANPKIALVLSGGTLTGAAFKIGGLKALNDYFVNKKLTDFDIYVGLSSGSLLALSLCGGISPEEMLASLDGRSSKFSQLSPFDLYYPNMAEYISRPIKFFYGFFTFLPGMLFDIARASPKLKEAFVENSKIFLKNPTYSNYEALTKPVFKVAVAQRHIPTLGELLPSGIFDNKRISRYLKKNMKKNQMPDNFQVLKRTTGKSLYITAMDLDLHERVIFGPDEKNDVPISEAAQASCATAGLYKPARVKGVDYVDGAIRKTLNLDLVFDKRADLCICYNPFKPYRNELFLEYLREDNQYITRNKRITDLGLSSVINQVFRTLFYTRLHNSLKALANNPQFKKDIIVIEPDENDDDYFMMNPLFYWTRAKAAKLGFDSVSDIISRHYNKVAKILKAYGIHMTDEIISKDKASLKMPYHDDQVIMDVLEKPQTKKRLKVILGGRS